MIARTFIEDHSLLLRAFGARSLPSSLAFAARHSADVSVLVGLESNGSRDLSSAKIVAADGKSPDQIARELKQLAGGIRAGTDRQVEVARKTMNRVPRWLMSP